MAKNLVIVESPAKAKTINKYLGKDYVVKASIGHIKDLPSKGLGVDVEHNFEPTYELIPDSKKRNNKKIVAELKKAAKEAEAIYLAADPDREGEAICQHLAEEIVPKRPAKPAYRVMFNEITKRAVNEAFEHPRQIDGNLVDAQQARRVLDRLVGYKVSPLLCRTIGGRLSAGRVQSVALRMVVEREREIEQFVKTEYWTIAANLSSKLPPAFDARLFKIDEQTVKTSGFDQELKKNEILINDETKAGEIVSEAEKQTFIVGDVTTKERKRNPVPPFITSKLQQEASRKLGFPVKRTMMIAQKLYEGIELGPEGSVGLITYMRTDSTRVSDTALGEVRDYIDRQYGVNYLPEKAVHYRSKKDAQDAHEAIRPTEVARTPDSLARFLKPEELKLYRLIWQRFVASQMMPAVFDQTTIDIQAGRFIFRATGSVQKFDGFLKIYQEGRDEKTEEDEEAERTLPMVEKGETLSLNSITPEQHFTDPPPRYTEATLVKALEEKGIGRPSTYAAIMSTIQEREYVEKIQSRFHPTALGKTVNDLLIDGGFDDLFNESYTARMEEELDEIEEGKIKWTKALREFYDKFEGDLKEFQHYVKDIKEKSVPTEEVCLKCNTPGMVQKWGRFGPYLKCLNCDATRDAEPPAGSDGAAGSSSEPQADGAEAEPEVCELCEKPMQMKRGRFGPFLGCTGYPECRNIRKIGKTGVAAPAPVPLDEKCPVDGAQLVKRFGRFGEFISCSNYPKCKYIKQETVGVSCPRPGCKGELVVKKSKRGKAFYGCSEYPNCNVVYWDKPVLETCPQCNAPLLLEKTTKKQGTFRYCANEDCGYRSNDTPEPIGGPPLQLFRTCQGFRSGCSISRPPFFLTNNSRRTTMMLRRYTAVVLLLLFIASPATLLAQTQTAPTPDPNDPIQRIKDEGMNRSQVMQTISYLSDVIGPRLTASPGMKRANEWTRDQLTRWGLQNARLESFGPFGRGWELKRFSAQVVEPLAIPLIAFPKAWSPGFASPITADVVYFDARTDADLEKYKGKLNGKIVLTAPMREVPAHFQAKATRLTEKELLALADAPEPRTGGGRGNFGNNPNARAAAEFAANKLRFFQAEGVALLIDPSRGDGGTLYVQSAAVPQPVRDPNAPPTRGISAYDRSGPKLTPQIVLAIEHYNRIVRMLQAGAAVKMTVDLAVAWQENDLMGYNTIAEIPGTDLKDEVVMLGGHMDSWHSGTGATDNAAGVAVAMEAVRIIQTLGLKPRRTIRVALWSGEEQGLLGSRAYVAQHLGSMQNPATSAAPATNGAGTNGNGNGAAPQTGPVLVKKADYEKFSAYFNLDNGTGKIRGVYLQGNEAVRPIFRQWLAPFRDMGATTLSISNTGGTDHLPFDAIGLPGFQFIQDDIEYDTRTHHSSQDVFDRIQADDMKQAATIMAAFVYQTAMRDQKLPRKPEPGSR